MGFVGSGREEACPDWKRNDDGCRKVGLRSWRGEGSPCWSRREMDMGRRLDPEFGSTVKRKDGLCRETTEQDASSGNWSWHIV